MGAASILATCVCLHTHRLPSLQCAESLLSACIPEILATLIAVINVLGEKGIAKAPSKALRSSTPVSALEKKLNKNPCINMDLAGWCGVASSLFHMTNSGGTRPNWMSKYTLRIRSDTAPKEHDLDSTKALLVSTGWFVDLDDLWRGSAHLENTSRLEKILDMTLCEPKRQRSLASTTRHELFVDNLDVSDSKSPVAASIDLFPDAYTAAPELLGSAAPVEPFGPKL